MSLIPNCDVCGGTIRHDEKTVQVRTGLFKRGLVAQFFEKYISQGTIAYCHLSCVLDGETGDSGKDNRKLVEKLMG